MAKIIEITLPEQYENANRYEIYSDLEKVSLFCTNLKGKLEDLTAEIRLRDSQLQKQRADILKLKSLVGHKNIEIEDLKLESEVIDITVEEVKTTSNFIPASVIFKEEKGTLTNPQVRKV